MTMEHPDDERLRQYKFGKLSQNESVLIEQHLIDCESCGLRLDELDEQTDALVRMLKGNLDETVAPTEFEPAESATASTSAPTTPRPDSGSPVGAQRNPSAADPATIPAYVNPIELGRGGMGVVYKAFDPRVQRDVALKIISPERGWRPELRSRFQVEAKSAARLQHANIVQLFEFGDHEGTLYCVFEFIDGGTLSDRIRQDAMPERDAATVLTTIADAVHYAHQRRILHRDLKPDNILLTRDGVPKIADFGLAKRLDEQTSKTLTGTPMGTPAYMSPEQVTDASETTTATDVYALGAILYEILVGRPPFRGDVMEVFDHVRNSEPTRPGKLRPGLSRDLESICLRCLEKDPNRRFSSAAELADELRRFLAGRPILSRPPSVWDRWWKLARRNPMAATFGTLFLVSVLTALPIVTLLYLNVKTALDRSNRVNYALQLKRASDIADTDPIKALEFLRDEEICLPKLRGFYWNALTLACESKRIDISDVTDVTAIDVSPASGLAALGTRSGELVIWDVTGRKVRARRTEHVESVTSVRFSDDGSHLATSSQDDRACIWSTDEFQLVRTLTLSESTHENDTNAILFQDQNRYLTAHADGVIRTWDEGSDPVEELVLNEQAFSTVAMDASADGRLIATCEGNGRGTIEIRNRNDWELVASIPFEEINKLCFHPVRPNVLVTTGAKRTARIWSLSPEGGVISEELSPRFLEKGSCITLSPSGKLVAAGSYDGTVKVWDMEFRRLVFEALCKVPVESVAFLSESQILVGTNGSPTQIWDLGQTMIPGSWGGEELGRPINDLLFDNVSETLIAPVGSQKLVVWDEHTRKQISQWNAPPNASIDSVSIDSQGTLLWASNQTIFQASSPRDLSTAAPYHSDRFSVESMIATSSGVVVSTTEYQTLLLSPRGGVPVWEQEKATSQLLYSESNDRIVALVNSLEDMENNHVWVANPSTGSGLEFSVGHKVTRLAVSQDGRRIACATQAGNIVVVDFQGRILSKSTPQPNTLTRAMKFTLDNHSLITIDRSGSIRFWDPTLSRILERGQIDLSGPSPKSIAFNDNQTRMYFGCQDGWIRFFDRPTEPTSASR